MKNMNDDLISRQAAIDAIERVPDGNWKSIRYSNEIRKLPTAEKKGRWQRMYDFEPWECDNCGNHSLKATCYCPKCGVGMNGNDNES